MDDPLANLSADEREALAELAKARVNGSMGRRDVMKLAGAGGIGALLGGGGFAAATEPASAQAVGQLGEPGDRVEVYGETVDSTAVNTGELDGILIPAGSDLSGFLSTNATLWLRPGERYTLSSPITENTAVRIEGLQGATKPSGGDPIIQYTGPTGTDTAVIDWSDSATPVVDSRIAHVSIDAGGADHALLGRYLTNRTHLEGVKVTNTASHAFDVSLAFYSWLEDCVARTNIGGDGYHIHETDGEVNDFILRNPQVNGASGRGIGIDAGNVGVENPTIEGTDDIGIGFYGDRLYLQNPYFENCGLTQTTPKDLELDGQVAMVNGGRFKPEAGGVGVDVLGNTTGLIAGSEHSVVDASNRPDYHIRSVSDYFDVWGVTATSSPNVYHIDIKGLAWGVNGNEFPLDRRTPTDLSQEYGRRWGEIRFDDGTNTSREWTGCVWRAADETWVPLDGSATFSGVVQ